MPKVSISPLSAVSYIGEYVKNDRLQTETRKHASQTIRWNELFSCLESRQKIGLCPLCTWFQMCAQILVMLLQLRNLFVLETLTLAQASLYKVMIWLQLENCLCVLCFFFKFYMRLCWRSANIYQHLINAH